MVYYILQVNPGDEGRRVDGGPVPPPNALRLPPNVASRPELQKKLGELLDAKARQERLLFEKQKLTTPTHRRRVDIELANHGKMMHPNIIRLLEVRRRERERRDREIDTSRDK